MITRRGAIGTIAMAVRANGAAARWNVSWEDEKSPLAIADFCVSRDGVAAAIGARKEAPILVSGDGRNWQLYPLPEPGSHVFALAEGFLWLLTEAGLWRSTDGGKSWKEQLRRPGLKRLFFLDERRGYVVGVNKVAMATKDGGASWTPIASSGESTSTSAYTSYHWVDFVTARAGIIAGTSRPPRHGNTGPLPAWRDPDRVNRRPEWPAASVTMETRDGGGTWKQSSTSLFGSVTHVRYARDGHGLALVEFHDNFEYPSEVFSIDLNGGKSERVFREKNRAVTDVLIFPERQALLACVEPPEDSARENTGNVHFLSGFNQWQEEAVPQAKKAGRVWLGGIRPDSVWAATDTGCILRRIADD